MYRYFPWSVEECPESHALTRPLSFYANISLDTDDEYHGACMWMCIVCIHVRMHSSATPATATRRWILAHGRWHQHFARLFRGTNTSRVLHWHSTLVRAWTDHKLNQTSHHILTRGQTNFTRIETTYPETPRYHHLESFTGAKVEQESVYQSTCDSTLITWDSMGGLGVRYVRNTAAATGERKLSDYDAYFKKNHAKFAEYNWKGWDHGFDQHIGTSCCQRID